MHCNLQDSWRVLVKRRVAVRDPDETPESIVGPVPGQDQESHPCNAKPQL